MAERRHGHKVGKVALVDNRSAFGFRVWGVRGAMAMRAAHTHPDVEINWVREGSVGYVLGGRRQALGAGELGVFWGGVPHRLEEQGLEVDGVWMTVPLRWFLRTNLPETLVGRLMRGEMVRIGLAEDRVRQWLVDFERGVEGGRLVLLELEAMLCRGMEVEVKREVRRSVGGSRKGGRVRLGVDGVVDGAVERALAYLALNYGEPLTIAAVGEAAGLHPNYLMEVFKGRCGMSVGAYLLALRLAHAQRLLVTTEDSVLKVALASGFGSVSRFYSAFAAEVGERPLQYRRRHWGAAVVGSGGLP